MCGVLGQLIGTWRNREGQPGYATGRTSLAWDEDRIRCSDGHLDVRIYASHRKAEGDLACSVRLVGNAGATERRRNPAGLPTFLSPIPLRSIDATRSQTERQ